MKTETKEIIDMFVSRQKKFPFKIFALSLEMLDRWKKQIVNVTSKWGNTEWLKVFQLQIERKELKPLLPLRQK